MKKLILILAFLFLISNVFAGIVAPTTTTDANALWNKNTTVTFTCTPATGETCNDLNYSINSGTWLIKNYGSIGVDQNQDTKSITVYPSGIKSIRLEQQFIPQKDTVRIITLNLNLGFLPHGDDLNISIQDDNGSDYANGLNLIDMNLDFNSTPSETDFNVTFPTNLNVTPGNKYWIVVSSSRADSYMWVGSSTNTYLNGICRISRNGVYYNPPGDMFFKEWYSEQTTHSITLTDGNNKIEYKSSDLNGNVESIKTSYHALDTVVPVTSFGGCTAGWKTTLPTITLTCTDATSGCYFTKFMLDNNGTYFQGNSISLVSDKNWRIDFNSTDNALNTNATQTNYCAVDTTAPVLATTDYNGFTTSTTYIKGTGSIFSAVTDPTSGVNQCYYTTGTTWATADYNTTHCIKNALSIVNAQSYTFDLNATDNAGNNGSATATSTYVGDTLAPTTSITQFIYPDTNIIQITLTCSDAGSGCATTQYRIDSGAWTNYTSDFNVSFLGVHSIDFNSIDNLGNQETSKNADLNGLIFVTIKYPINEATLVKLTEKWRLTVTLGTSLYYTDLNTDKNIYLPTNVLNNIYVEDVNGNYFGRNYQLTFTGTDSNYTLQPYLVPVATGLLTTINTREATTNQPIPNLTFKIYKNIPGLGSTLVETIVTDAKGQGLVLLVLNANYDFNVFYGTTWIKNFNITATSSTIYFIIDLGTTVIPPTTQKVFTSTFTPKPNLVKAYSGNQTFTQTLNNLGLDTISIVSMVQQNGVNLDANQLYSGSSSHTFTHTINWSAIGTLPVTSKMIVTASDGNVYTFTQTYLVTVSDGNTFGSTYSPLTGLTTGLRQDFACEYNTTLYYLSPCYPLLIIAVIICIALTLWASVSLGQMNGQAAGLIFLISMILFTFLTWIPVYLTVGLALIILAFIVNDRGGQ